MEDKNIHIAHIQYHGCWWPGCWWCKEPWASCQIRKIEGCACAGNAGKDFPRRRIRRKPWVSDPGMHHGTCVTHVPWCMSESLTHGGGENVPGIPGARAPAILLIWQEAHGISNCGIDLIILDYSGFSTRKAKWLVACRRPGLVDIRYHRRLLLSEVILYADWLQIPEIYV